MCDSFDIDILLKMYPDLKFLGFTPDGSYAKFSYFGNEFLYMTSDPFDKQYDFVKHVSDYLVEKYSQVTLFDLI